MRNTSAFSLASVAFTAFTAFTVFTTLATVAAAQCRPPAGSNESKLLAIYSAPVIFAADQLAIGGGGGLVRLSVEGSLVPQPGRAIQQTGYCYTGKAENTSLTRFFGRPRLALALPWGVGVEASYLPAVTVADATPRLASGAFWITRPALGANVTLRAHGTRGTVTGPITCPSSALQQTDSEAPCYSDRPSSDHFQPNDFGGELLVSTLPSASRFRFMGGVGVNALRPRFQVGFHDLLGGTDRTRIAVDLTRFIAEAGVAANVGSRCGIESAAYASFGDAVTVRAIAGCALVR